MKRRKRHTKYPRAVEHKVSEKIRLLREEGYPAKQAAAIAYRMYGIGYSAKRDLRAKARSKRSQIAAAEARYSRDSEARTSQRGSHYVLRKTRHGWQARLMSVRGRTVAVLHGAPRAERGEVVAAAKRRWPGTHELARDMRAKSRMSRDPSMRNENRWEVWDYTDTHRGAHAHFVGAFATRAAAEARVERASRRGSGSEYRNLRVIHEGQRKRKSY